MSTAPDSPTAHPSQQYVAPDFKRRQLLFDSFTKLGASGGSSQKNISDQAVSSHGGAANSAAEHEIGPKGTLLYTWGAGYHGQLGLNTFRKKCRMLSTCIDFKEPVLIVACGGFHTAVLTDDGRVYTWGDGRYGQLGNLARKHNMHSTPHLVEEFVTYRINITQIACGQYHTAAISSQGKLFTWGSGRYGQLGHGVRLDERFPKKVESDRVPVTDSTSPVSPSRMGRTGGFFSFGNFTRVSCGDRHTAVVNEDGRVITMGAGQHGQLGHGNGLDQLRPVMIQDALLSAHVVTSIESGSTTTAAVTSTGLFFLWGFGESIHPKGCSNIQDTPRLVRMKEPVKQVACGQSHILVLTDAGDVYSFGMASFGQLGHGSKTSVRNPRLILRGKEIHQIAAGRYHSMAVTAYGVLYSWGCSESGQLSHNSLDSEFFPRIVENILPNVVGQISCGEHHSFALTSIAHSAVSPDVLNWKLIEDEELKLKKAMLHDVPNGLKSKHILQVEQERKGIIKQLAESLRKEREENSAHASQQMSLIRAPEELVSDVKTHQQQLLLEGDSETIATVNTMSQAAAKLMLTSESNPYLKHEKTQEEEEDERDEEEIERERRNKKNKRKTLSSSVSALLHTMQQPGLIGSASAAELMSPSRHSHHSPSPSRTMQRSQTAHEFNTYDEEKEHQAANNASNAASTLASPINHTHSHSHSNLASPSPSSHTLHKSATTSSLVTPSNKRNIDSPSKLAPLRPSTALTVALGKSKKHRDSTHSLPAHEVEMTPEQEHEQHQSQALIEYHSQQAQQQLIPFSPHSTSFQPLAPRMAFAEQTVKALTWVKNMVSTNPNHEAVVNYNVIRLQKQYNAMKNKRNELSVELEHVKGALALTKPSPEEEDTAKANTERIKQLNMKLVTLNTRLMEAEENKKNYELYIIRMKEEDLQLSKQIEHLRQLVTEYDRLLAKVERMSQRVLTQKGEIHEELQHFQHDITDFIEFADRVVSDYRTMLNSNFRKNQLMDQELERRLDFASDIQKSTISKLESQVSTTEAQANEVKDKLASWEDKVEYYEKRFRKLSNSTGLSRSEQIIAKHYFNSEITSDLKMDIEHKQDTLLALQQQQKSLEQALRTISETHTDSRWRDVAQLEDANIKAVNRLLRTKADSELWQQKVTLFQEGLLALHKKVEHALTPEHEYDPSLALIIHEGNQQQALSQPSTQTPPEELYKRMEENVEKLLLAIQLSKDEQIELYKRKDEQERLAAARSRQQQESMSEKALDLAKAFIAPKTFKHAQEEKTQEEI